MNASGTKVTYRIKLSYIHAAMCSSFVKDFGKYEEREMQEKNMPQCEDCRFWKPIDRKGDRGECRRYPPHPHSEWTFVWRKTKRDDWCGEFDPTPAPT